MALLLVLTAGLRSIAEIFQLCVPVSVLEGSDLTTLSALYLTHTSEDIGSIGEPDARHSVSDLLKELLDLPEETAGLASDLLLDLRTRMELPVHLGNGFFIYGFLSLVARDTIVSFVCPLVEGLAIIHLDAMGCILESSPFIGGEQIQIMHGMDHLMIHQLSNSSSKFSRSLRVLDKSRVHVDKDLHQPIIGVIGSILISREPTNHTGSSILVKSRLNQHLFHRVQDFLSPRIGGPLDLPRGPSHRILINGVELRPTSRI